MCEGEAVRSSKPELCCVFAHALKTNIFIQGISRRRGSIRIISLFLGRGLKYLRTFNTDAVNEASPVGFD